MESSQPENGLVMEKMTVQKSQEDLTEADIKSTYNGSVKDETAVGEDSSTSFDLDKSNPSPPHLSPISPVSENKSLETAENGVNDHVNSPGPKEQEILGPDSLVKQDCRSDEEIQKGTAEGKGAASIPLEEEKNASSMIENEGGKKALEVEESANSSDIALKTSTDSFPEGNQETSSVEDSNNKNRDDGELNVSSLSSDGSQNEKENKNMMGSVSQSLVESIEKEGNVENVKKKAETNKHEEIPPQIFEDITEDEDSGDEENLENIELELDDLIDPAELSKNHSSGDKVKCDINCDTEVADAGNKNIKKRTSSVEEKSGFCVDEEKVGLTRSASESDVSADVKESLFDSERPRSSVDVIKDQPVERKDSEEHIYQHRSPPSSDSNKAASTESRESGTVRKQKFTARKSGKPVNQTETSALKTINLHPIKNITMKLSDIEGALDYSPVKESSITKFVKSTNSDSTKVETSIACTSPQSDSTLVNSASKGLTGIKKKRRKNTYDFPGFKKKAKKARSDELESLGSSADSVSLSDGDFQDMDVSKDMITACKEDNPASQKTESALDVLTKNYHLGFGKKSKPSITSSPQASSSSSLSPLVSSSLSSRSMVGKSNSKMKSVLDMLHARSKQKAESEERISGSTTITTVSVTTSATTTTTTILVSPLPNKPIVEGVKRKGTPRKRRGKRKRDSLDGAITQSTASVTSANSQAAKQKINISTPSSQSPVVMVVAQHSSAPGLRSLLPRHALVTPAGTSTNKLIQPAPGSLLSSFPLISTLPVGAKAISLASLPSGMTAVPITSLPPGSQQTMTFFTTVPTTVGAAAVPIPFTGASLVNIAQPKQQQQVVGTMSLPKSMKTLSSSSTTLSSSLTAQTATKTSTVSPSHNNSDSLRALLVGKPYTFTRVTSATSSQLSSTPMLFQMVTTSGASLVPISAQPMTLTPSAVAPNVLKPSAAVSSSKSSYSLIKPHPPNVPNGVSCLTPPKTPDTDSSSEVAVAASLSRPIPGQVEDSEVIPLCSCKTNGASFNKLFSGVTYCQALDTVDNKVLGCCNKVSNSQLVRPGVKIPFMAVCEVHRKRLKLHQCCPGCGHFCTQGKFQQCRKEGKSSVHNFHKQCVFYRGGKYYCPHCGEETSQCEVELRLNESKTEDSKPVPARAAKRGSERKTARIGCKTFVKSKSTYEVKDKTITLPNNKIINFGALSLGPDQATMTKLCRCASEDRPKKYRTLPKDLYTPASEGDVEKIFYLLYDGMDPNTRYEDNEDQTALHTAAVSGHFGVVFLLEQFGAEIHAQDRNLRTPLMCAAENGHLNIVQFLIKSGAKVEDRGEDGMTSLHYAAKAGYIDIIQYILETEKLDVNIQDDGGWTPIIWATESQLLDVVKYLLSQGGDPNKKDNEENTGLHWAAFAGSIDIAEMFVDMGCEIDAVNEHGDRPLHIAARQDHYDIVVLLLARGADVNTKNNKDETPVESCGNKSGQVWMALKVNQQLRSFAARKLIHPERLMERDITMGREKNPIACVNAEDSEPCPSDFLYVVENVETTPLNINYIVTSLQSCRCKDDCSSMYCVCGRSSIKCWYDKMGRLLEEVNLLEPPLVFECNRACRCPMNCNNRVVQNGITCRLQLFRTNGRGWGVRTLMDIPKGTFVCEYIGELISDSEADRREDDSYLFDLDNKDGDTYCIDARKYGNISRFINHLCEPNLVPVKVFVEHQDLRFPRICLFSSRDVKAYEELGFDYGEKFWIIKWKHFTCACKSSKCKYSNETIKKTLADYKLRYPDEPVDN